MKQSWKKALQADGHKDRQADEWTDRQTDRTVFIGPSTKGRGPTT